MKAMIYVRVSSDEQVRGTSLESQEAACRRYCVARGYDVAALWRDAGESAKTADRPEFQRMIAAAVAQRLEAALTPRTRLVVLSHLLWNTGQTMPIAAVAGQLAGCLQQSYGALEALQQQARRVAEYWAAGGEQAETADAAESRARARSRA